MPSDTTVWRRRVKNGYRPSHTQRSTITRAYENNDYSALLRAIKDRTLWSDGCWLWLGRIEKDGSPRADLRVKSVRVRRLVSEAYIGGRLESRDKIWGTCSHTDCVNPEHLQIRIYHA